MPPAKISTKAAPGAFPRVYICYLPAPEIVFLPHRRGQQQVQISRIHIAIGQHLVLG
jgi:hypothetical protein